MHTRVPRVATQAKFVGQTADKVTEMFKAAQGGVLFIDEAHNLAPGKAPSRPVDDGRGVLDRHRGSLT